MMKNCLVISLTSLTLLMACANNTTTGNPKSDISPANNITTGNTTFGIDRGFGLIENCPSLQADSPSIEQELNQAMGQTSKIIKVKLPRPVEPAKEGLQPTVLAEVMAAVEKSGGKVSYEPIKADMAIGMVPLLLYVGANLIFQWLTSGSPVATVATVQSRFPQASRFDARMCYFEQDNKVTMMVLVPRGMDQQVTCINN